MINRKAFGHMDHMQHMICCISYGTYAAYLYDIADDQLGNLNSHNVSEFDETTSYSSEEFGFLYLREYLKNLGQKISYKKEI